MPHKLLYHIICLMVLIPILGFTQPEIAEIKHFGRLEGLDYPRVLRIYQDENNILWLFCTETDALFFENYYRVIRFDGHHFSSIEDSLFAQVNFFYAAQFNKNKLVIINKDKDLVFWETESGNQQILSLDPFTENGAAILTERNTFDSLFFLYHVKDKAVLAMWNGKDSVDSLHAVPYTKQPWSSGEIISTDDNVWWSLNSIGLFRYDRKTKAVKQYFGKDMVGLNIAANTRVEGVTLNETADGEIIVGLRDIKAGFLKFNAQKDKFQNIEGIPFHLKNHYSFKDDVGQLILTYGKFGDTQAMYFLGANNEQIDYSFILEKISASVFSVHSTNFKKHLWLGTSNGLYYVKFNPDPERIIKLLPGHSMRNIIEFDSSKTLFSTENAGWFLWDEKVGSTSPFRVYENGKELSLDYCRGFFLDENDKLWASNFSKLLKINIQNRQASSFPARGGIQTFIRLKNGHFLYGTSNSVSLSEFNPDTEKYQFYMPEQPSNPLEEKFCHVIYEAENGIIWVGTDKGLIKFDKANNLIKIYTLTEAERSTKIMTIHEEPDGNLWLGTTESGVKIFNPKTERFSILGKSEGLIVPTVAGIIKDEKGDFWFSTFFGLSCYKPKSQMFLNFTSEDGLIHNEFNRYSFYRKSDGRLCMGTLNGMNIFDPQALKAEESSPKLLLHEVEYFDKQQQEIVLKKYNLNSLKEITLPASDRYLQMRFGLSEITEIESHRFSAYLEGYDKYALNLKNRNSVTYNNLPSGQYILHLNGLNSRGQHNVNEVKIKIIVEEYFYKTAWFFALSTLAFIGIVYAVYRYRLSQMYKMMELRTKIASDLHDDVGGLLTGIAMQSELLQLNKNIKDQSQIEKIRTMSQKAISQMRDLVWSVDARKDNLENLFDRMYEYATETLQPKGINLIIETPGLNTSKQLSLEIRQNIYLIFKEAITNILRHSNATEVVITAKLVQNQFELKIKDNGRLNNPGTKPSGLGLLNMKRRAEKMKAKIEFERENGFGIIIRV